MSSSSSAENVVNAAAATLSNSASDGTGGPASAVGAWRHSTPSPDPQHQQQQHYNVNHPAASATPPVPTTVAAGSSNTSHRSYMHPPKTASSAAFFQASGSNSGRAAISRNINIAGSGTGNGNYSGSNNGSSGSQGGGRPVSELFMQSLQTPNTAAGLMGGSIEGDILDKWHEDLNQFERTLNEMSRAVADSGFKDELGAVEKWFLVLNEPEQLALLYTLLQHTSPVQSRFLSFVLQKVTQPDIHAAPITAGLVGSNSLANDMDRLHLSADSSSGYNSQQQQQQQQQQSRVGNKRFYDRPPPPTAGLASALASGSLGEGPIPRTRLPGSGLANAKRPSSVHPGIVPNLGATSAAASPLAGIFGRSGSRPQSFIETDALQGSSLARQWPSNYSQQVPTSARPRSTIELDPLIASVGITAAAAAASVVPPLPTTASITTAGIVNSASWSRAPYTPSMEPSLLSATPSGSNVPGTAGLISSEADIHARAAARWGINHPLLQSPVPPPPVNGTAQQIRPPKTSDRSKFSSEAYQQMDWRQTTNPVQTSQSVTASGSRNSPQEERDNEQGSPSAAAAIATDSGSVSVEANDASSAESDADTAANVDAAVSKLIAAQQQQQQTASSIASRRLGKHKFSVSVIDIDDNAAAATTAGSSAAPTGGSSVNPSALATSTASNVASVANAGTPLLPPGIYGAQLQQPPMSPWRSSYHAAAAAAAVAAAGADPARPILGAINSPALRQPPQYGNVTSGLRSGLASPSRASFGPSAAGTPIRANFGSIHSGVVPSTPKPPPVDGADIELIKDIPAWLRALRLHKYQKCVEDLHWEQMIELDEAALEARGVAALGARRKMIKIFEVIRPEVARRKASGITENS